jgi:6-phosphogluconolactonase
MKRYKTSQELEDSLCEGIVGIIHLSIRQYGDARILLSGGSSPVSLYKQLAQVDLNWSKVKIGLVDDRCVSLDSEFSNERMLREIFESTKNSTPSIYSLVDPPQGAKVEEHYADFFERTDFVLLGMGNDGHTASLFPGDPVSEHDLWEDKTAILHTTAPNFPFDRITCSKGLIKLSSMIALMIFGVEKLHVLQQAEEINLPINVFVEECPQLTTYYSPTT